MDTTRSPACETLRITDRIMEWSSWVNCLAKKCYIQVVGMICKQLEAAGCEIFTVSGHKQHGTTTRMDMQFSDRCRWMPDADRCEIKQSIVGVDTCSGLDFNVHNCCIRWTKVEHPPHWSSPCHEGRKGADPKSALTMSDLTG